MYTRMLDTYYVIFNKKFSIKGVLKEGDGYMEVDFEPGSDLKFIGFIVERNQQI